MVNDQMRARQRILEIQCFVRNKVFVRQGFVQRRLLPMAFFRPKSSFRHASAVPAKKHSVYLSGSTTVTWSAPAGYLYTGPGVPVCSIVWAHVSWGPTDAGSCAGFGAFPGCTPRAL